MDKTIYNPLYMVCGHRITRKIIAHYPCKRFNYIFQICIGDCLIATNMLIYSLIINWYFHWKIFISHTTYDHLRLAQYSILLSAVAFLIRKSIDTRFWQNPILKYLAIQYDQNNLNYPLFRYSAGISISIRNIYQFLSWSLRFETVQIKIC